MRITPGRGAQPFTGEEFVRLPKAGCRYELLRGALIRLPFHGALHHLITERLTTNLFPPEVDKLGAILMAGTGCYLSRDPDTVLAPDGAFIRVDRVPEPLPIGYSEVIPDLVVETRDPGQPPSEVAFRIRRWLMAGASVVLDVDPKRETVHVHRPHCDTVELHRDDTLVVEDLLPGVRVPLERVFGYSAG